MLNGGGWRRNFGFQLGESHVGFAQEFHCEGSPTEPLSYPLTKKNSEEMKERKRHMIEVFLLIIITLYERETRAFRNYWYDPDPPHYCDRKVRLADFGQLPVIFLNSFPGSGNT